MIFYNIISLFGLLLGYIIYDLLTQYNIIEASEIFNSSVVTENAGFLMIFKNNLLFFSLICIMPILNVMFTIIQFFNLGALVYMVKGISIESQIRLLYRHTIFEIIALLFSVYISYIVLLVGREYIKDKNISKAYYFNKIKHISLIYLIVVILSCIGALLEGNVIVPV